MQTIVPTTPMPRWSMAAKSPRVIGSVLLALAAILAMPDAARSDSPGGSSGLRFELTRSRDFLFRLDSSTGQVSAVPLNGDGGWQTVGAAPAALGEPATAGRYQLVVMAGGRGGPGSREKTPRLLLTDRATGRAWLAVALPDGEWSEIASPPSATATP